MAVESVSFSSLIRTVMEIITTHSEIVFYILGLLTLPFINGLLSQLPTEAWIHRVQRQTNAEDNFIQWLEKVEELAGQLEHEVNTDGIARDGTLPEQTTEKFEDLIALQKGPKQPIDGFSESADEMADRIRDVRNAYSDLDNAPSHTEAQQELEDLLEQTRNEAEKKRMEVKRVGLLFWKSR